MRDRLRTVLHRLGLEVSRWPARAPVGTSLRTLKIDTVLDVGANVGQYGQSLRALGFRGRILSFEPVSAAYQVLAAVCARDPAWQCYQIALGEIETRASLTVAASTALASFLPLKPFAHDVLVSASRPVDRETVSVRRLDALVPMLDLADQRLYLKCDTQGFELPVLRGAGTLLTQLSAVQLELSVRPLYDGQPTFDAVVAFMRDASFVLNAVIPGFSDPQTGELLEMDGIFVRRGIDR